MKIFKSIRMFFTIFLIKVNSININMRVMYFVRNSCVEVGFP